MINDTLDPKGLGAVAALLLSFSCHYSCFESFQTRSIWQAYICESVHCWSSQLSAVCHPRAKQCWPLFTRSKSRSEGSQWPGFATAVPSPQFQVPSLDSSVDPSHISPLPPVFMIDRLVVGNTIRKFRVMWIRLNGKIDCKLSHEILLT